LQVYKKKTKKHYFILEIYFFFNELSAGVGRTGAYIAIDSLIENINNKKNIDVFNKVLEIRLYRVSMVQNQFQYRFIYEMLNYYYKRGIIHYICYAFLKNYKLIYLIVYLF